MSGQVPFDRFTAAHARLFDRLATACTFTRGAAAAQPGRCIVKDGVETLGQYGQVLGRARHVLVIKQEWDPVKGDLVTLNGSGQRIERIDKDDGIVAEAVLNG